MERMPDESGPPSPVKVIEPRRGWRWADLAAVWDYRDLVAVLALRDIKVRYKQTALGSAWVLLRPLGSMAVYTAVFGFLVRVPSGGHPYWLFVLAGLLPWGLLSQAAIGSGGSLLSSASLIGKVWFPRIVLPIVSVIGGLVDLVVSTLLLLVVLPLAGVPWSPSLLWLPVLVLAVTAASLGVATLFSALTVTSRDFGNLSGYLVQAWFYATPVIYPASLVPERWRFLLAANPLAAQVEAFRGALLGGPVDARAVGISILVSVVLLLAGMAWFSRVERRFADIL